jgi:basic membrane lipoprotein Med (substrate-binding protein (PBP1-ABC) superfamily)
VAREVKSGTFKPRVIQLGSESDVVSLVINPALRSRIPASALQTVDSIRAEMKAGRFDAQGAAPR